ncbi:HPP family protein [Rathayibacter sp. AY1E2]|uniref:CBS domain-containing protein n=1 Tax=Rathayibacter sp. AY1E2 TaxID=2080550 RepID=UPI0011B05C8F|nr:CBS domain-containing protein [Rathayibacter sp. AY1E2]
MSICPKSHVGVAPEGTGLNVVEEEMRTSKMRVGEKLSMRFIPSATVKPLTFVAETDSLERATTLMNLNDFSQLPVVRGKGRPVGVISWHTIGQTLFSNPDASLKDCMEEAREVLLDSDLLDAIPMVNANGYVLVTDSRGFLSGIVTSADLGQALSDIANPFLLVERCEMSLRKIVDELLDSRLLSEKELLESLPSSASKEFKGSSDLTFGELSRIVTSPVAWKSFGARMDRKEVSNSLDRIARLRNILMHFRERDDEFGRAQIELPKMAQILSILSSSITA